MELREKPAGRPRGMPPAIAAASRGRGWSRDLVGESGCSVFRLSRSGEPDLYLKRGRGGYAADVADEAARLRWLDGRLPCPRVVAFEEAGGTAWLATTAVPGITAWVAMEAADDGARAALAGELARFLRGLHALDPADCPFDAGAAVRTRAAAARLEAGLIDEDDFDPERRGWSAERVWREMEALLPLAGDEPVVTHGDCSLDNLMIADGRVAGCVDLGRLGRADRYQDLAILWNCLREWGDAPAEAMLRAYGEHPPDERRMRFHLLLDECF